MASLLTSLCYFFYPQHLNKFNKKIRTVKMFILTSLPMSEPDHLKYSFRFHMSNFSIHHSYTYIGRYIIYIIMDAILAAADHVPWLRLWIAVFHMAPAIIYFFSFSLFKYLEQLQYLLQVTFEDLVAFKKKVESQSKLSLSGTNI
uniref:Uncharacterized protein n=1 Tax=Cacopsylla melanoneura TaxID=428564 RepID=A0A8D8RVK5_9HEMI